MRLACLLLMWLMVVGNARAQALLHPVPLPASPVAPERASSDDPPSGQPSDAVTDIQKPTFRGGIDLVALNVVVTDREQRFVTGLSASRFAVFEDGVQQDVSFFATAEVPLDLAILLDTSASMGGQMPILQETAIGFASTLRGADRAMIVDIKDRTRILQPLTSDLSKAIAAINATVASGGTGFYNGLYLTLKELARQRREQAEVRRQAIVVVSDGEDTTSLVSFEDVMEVAKRSGIAIYTIALRSTYEMRAASSAGRRYFSQSDFTMKALARETGARSFFPTEATELADVYGSIAEELATQYSLGYTSTNARRDGQFRRVVVRVADVAGGRTRTRSGYVAAARTVADRR